MTEICLTDRMNKDKNKDMSVAALARPEIVAMKPYSSARLEAPGRGILLNANESPWSLLDEELGGLDINRYPEPQPEALVAELADLYAVAHDQVLVTRGSDEGIDLLTRVFCRAGQDAILHCPPTFGMYRVAAQAQGAAVVNVQRSAESGFELDGDDLLEALQGDERIRLVFLTSPNNPIGDTVSRQLLLRVLDAAAGRALVVVDEAYAEFSEAPSACELIARYPHLVVLRTLSKAWASAGLRCGSVLAQAEVLTLLRRVIAPYPLAAPVTAMALRVLQPDMRLRQQKQLRELMVNKKILLELLQDRTWIKRLWPGEANFVLLQVDDAAGLLAHCAARNIILRGFPADPSLRDCLRISIGSSSELAALKTALDEWKEVSA
jgi:histidinol-phosphate aminotransferase